MAIILEELAPIPRTTAEIITAAFFINTVNSSFLIAYISSTIPNINKQKPK